jgi:hypothetical protein
MTREISTTEALMTDPTTEEGRTYWQQRHDHEAALERRQIPACDRCTQGVMDADQPGFPGNDHLYGRCTCDCHQADGP